MRTTRPDRFDVLICYDVDTTTSLGRRRLRKVAKALEGYGQRVQYSVFECSLSDTLLEKLRNKLLDIIDDKQDNLRFYFLHGSREQWLKTYGRDGWVDFHGTLVV